jgi:hypothetical protein
MTSVVTEAAAQRLRGEEPSRSRAFIASVVAGVAAAPQSERAASAPGLPRRQATAGLGRARAS